MVIVIALFNVPQYTRMVSLTRDYIYMMTEPVFIYFELMFINYWFIAHFELAMPKIAKNGLTGLYITKTMSRHPRQVPVF